MSKQEAKHFYFFYFLQKNKELMNDIIMNCKSKNGGQTSVLLLMANIYISNLIFQGFATPVQTIAPVSPSKKQLSPDHPNPALPITEVSH